MARTHKIQAMHEYHQHRGGVKGGCGGNPFHTVGAGYRYGNNRHSFAKDKVRARKVERHKLNRLTEEV